MADYSQALTDARTVLSLTYSNPSATSQYLVHYTYAESAGRPRFIPHRIRSVLVRNGTEHPHQEFLVHSLRLGYHAGAAFR